MVFVLCSVLLHFFVLEEKEEKKAKEREEQQQQQQQPRKVLILNITGTVSYDFQWKVLLKPHNT